MLLEIPVVLVAMADVLVAEAPCNTPIADPLLVVMVLIFPSVASFAVTRVSIPVVLVSPVASPDCSAVINAFCCVITCVKEFTISWIDDRLLFFTK